VSDREAAEDWGAAGTPYVIGEASHRRSFGTELMRQFFVAGLLMAGFAAIAAPSLSRTLAHARAVASESAPDRYCISGDQWGYDCEFSTYEQCKATLSGTGGSCSENRRYLFEEQQRGNWPPR
jgi:hypothetical protein